MPCHHWHLRSPCCEAERKDDRTESHMKQVQDQVGEGVQQYRGTQVNRQLRMKGQEKHIIYVAKVDQEVLLTTIGYKLLHGSFNSA